MKNRFILLCSLAATAALMSPGAFAAAVSIADVTWNATGAAGLIAGNSTIPNPPTGNTQFGYVSTAGGVYDTSPLVLKTDGKGNETTNNGSRAVSGSFSAGANDTLTLNFNYLSTDGRGYDDYAWARLVTAGTNVTAAWLFTARSTNSANGNVVPGDVLKRQVDGSLPDRLDAELNNGDTVSFGVSSTEWAPLGFSSGFCWDNANTCGPSGWIKSDYTFNNTGTYFLEFGVANWGDEAYDSALAFDFGGLRSENFSNFVAIDAPAAPVPEPESWALLMAGLGLMGAVARRRRQHRA
jgi:hypothetical protein